MKQIASVLVLIAGITQMLLFYVHANEIIVQVTIILNSVCPMSFSTTFRAPKIISKKKIEGCSEIKICLNALP